MIEAMKQALNKAFQLGQRYWSWSDSEYSSHWKKADAAKAEFDKLVEDICQAIAEAEKQEPVAWKNAAIRLGEELSSVGPDGYYNMTAKQWLDWAIDQQPRGKNSLPQLKREWVGLTDDEYRELHLQMGAVYFYQDYGKAIEAKLKEKNT